MSVPIPNEITDFEAFLVDKGLVCQRRQGPDRKAFGNRILTYGNGSIGVRLILDRSIWMIEIADVAYSPDRWYDLDILQKLLLDNLDDLSLDAQISMAKNYWPAIIDRFSPQHREDTHRRLDFLRKERAKRLFGL